MGKTTWKWYGKGYQRAMLDVARALNESPERATEWIKDNMTDPEMVDALKIQPLLD